VVPPDDIHALCARFHEGRFAAPKNLPKLGPRTPRPHVTKQFLDHTRKDGSFSLVYTKAPSLPRMRARGPSFMCAFKNSIRPRNTAQAAAFQAPVHAARSDQMA